MASLKTAKAPKTISVPEPEFVLIESPVTAKKRFTEFANEYGGFKPQDFNEFMNLVNNNHQEIRSSLNGLSYTCETTLESTTIPVSPTDKTYLKAIALLNKAFTPDGRSTSILTFGPLTNVCRLRENNGIKSADSILKDFKKYIANPNATEKKPGQWAHRLQNIKDLHSGLSLLGDCWTKYNIKAMNLIGTISTEAEAFWKIGHYRAEIKGSCFRQGGGHNQEKYIVAQSLNSFVFLVSREDGIVGRSWGFFEFDEKKNLIAVHSFNPYVNSITPAEFNAVLFATIDSKFPRIFKNKTVTNIAEISKRLVYNNQQTISFLTESDQGDRRNFEVENGSLKYNKYCSRCSGYRIFNPKTWKYIQSINGWYCPACN